MSRVTLAVAGMHCNHCVTKVAQALQAVEGVQHVAVFLDAGEAEVDVSEGTPGAQLAAAVSAVGYPAAVKPA